MTGLNQKNKYSLASSTWDKEETEAAIEVIKSGKCTMGAIVSSFEKQFCNTFGCKYAVMSNSGSSANLIMMAALKYIKNKYKLKDGDEVLVPAVSWATTYYPIFQNRLTMRFVDIDINTLNIDENIIEEAITDKTKAILAVNILGNSCNLVRLKEICEKHNLVLIEDNCESMFAKYENKFCGTWGAMGTFSSFFSHHICTVEGGMTITDDEEIYQHLISLRAHGWTRELPNKNYVFNKTGNVTDDLFKFVLPGYNVRPNEIFAAIGIQQLKKLPQFVENRKKNHLYFSNRMSYLNDKFENLFRIQQHTTNSSPSFFAFTLVLEGKMESLRQEYMEFLISNGIECRPIVAGNFLKQPVLQHLEFSVSGKMSNSEKIDRSGLFIGNHSFDIAPQIDYFIQVTELFLINKGIT